MFHIKKECPLTLIEITVAFFLMGMVLFFLFSTFHSSNTLSKKIAEVRPKVFARGQCFQRLLHIFSSVDSDTLVFEENDDDTKSLHFLFSNPIDIERIYSGKVQGCIKLEKDMLVLEISPRKEGVPPRKEILLRKVEAFSWNTETPYLLLLEVKQKEKKPVLFPILMLNTEGISLQQEPS